MQLLIQMPQLQRLVPLLQYHFLALHAFEQFIQINRLLVVIGKAGAQRLDHILLARLPGEHDRLESPMLAGQLLQLLDHLDAVQARHMQIAEHQADFRVLVETFDRLMAGFAGNATVAAVLKKFAKFCNDLGLIVDHKDFYCRSTLVHVQLPARPRTDRPFIDSLRLYNL